MSPRVAILFDRFGPYHWARLNACSERFPTLGIELCGESNTYAWDRIDQAAQFQRTTLFPGRSSETLEKREVRQAIRECLTAQQPDAVAVSGWAEPAALAALEWCQGSGTPAIMMSESTEHDAARFWIKESIKWQIVRSCSAAIVGGSRHRNYIVKLGMPSDRVFCGYDVVDNDHFSRHAQQALDYGLRTRDNRPSFLASNRFVEKKNLSRLIEAYGAYRESTGKSAWRLILLGDGPLRSALESQVSSLNLCDDVEMPGFKQYAELPDYYANASAFVHASTVEQWGLVVNEAMASGLPVLVSRRCGCTPDLVRDGVNGFTFDPLVVADIASALSRISNLSPDKRKVMGAASRDVIREWSPQRFAQAIFDCVRVAMTRPVKPRLLSRFVVRALCSNQ